MTSAQRPPSQRPLARLDSTFDVSLGIIMLCGIALLIMRMWNRRGPKQEVVEAEPHRRHPDLTDENVGADQLPETAGYGWLEI